MLQLKEEEIIMVDLKIEPYRLPYNAKLKERARFLRNNQTNAEKKLWYQFLSLHRVKFNRQKIIDNYIVDFYCAKYKLVIELDGPSHDDDEAFEKDKMRTKKLESYGLTVIRFSNYQIYEYFEGVINEIESFLK